MPFSRYQELALYHPSAGYYSARGNAGRGGDFITSPEVGPLFARVIASALDQWWRQLRRPDPFFVIEAGAGSGTLAADILQADPLCLPALRYITVERSAAQRGEQAGRLAIQPADKVILSTPDPAVGPVVGPLVATLPELPEGPLVGVVLANELLDNLPVDLYERRGRQWFCVNVGFGSDGGLAEVLLPVEDGDPVDMELRRLVPDPAPFARVPLQPSAVDWLRRALGLLERGKVVAFDYVRTTRWMSRHGWEDWLRTYRGHRPGTSPFDLPGSQDITCEVAVDQLSQVQAPQRDRDQAEFLDAHGLHLLVSEAREAWHSRAAIGDLGAMKARSRVQEGRALTDVKGLGRYRVLEWDVPPRRPKEQ